MAKRVNRKQINEKPVSTINKSIDKNSTVAKSGMSSKMKLCIFLGILSFLVYANTLHNGYAGDDDFFIGNNNLVNRGIKGIPELLTTPHMKGIETVSNDTYRPLSLVMFAIENELFGNNPAFGHLFNILLFCGCVVVLFLFFDRLMEQKKITVAFIAALLFAVHPVHTEVVANIKSRDELLCFFLAFWSLNSFLSYLANGKNTGLVVGASTLFLSLLSKETSISFIFIIPLIFFFYCTGNRKRSIKIAAASMIAVAAFLVVRIIVLHEVLPTRSSALLQFMDNQLVDVPAGSSALATAIFACGYYIKLLFIPYPLLSNYSFSTIPFVDFGNIWTLLSLTAYLVLAFLGFYRIVKYKKDLWAFGILFFLITIALFSNIIFYIPAIFGERFLFFASIGFCLLVGLAIEYWSSRLTKPESASQKLFVLMNTKVLLFLIPVVVIFTSMTVSRNEDWENGYIVFKSDVKNAPQNAYLHCGLGSALLDNLNNYELSPAVRSRMTKSGIDYLKRAVEIYPRYSYAHAVLGEFYIIKQLFDSAEIHEKTAIMLDSTNVLAMDHLGLTYLNTGKFSEALNLYKKVMEINPGMVTEYVNIGLCYLGLHNGDSAVLYFRKALAAQPENSKFLYGQIATSFRDMGKMDSVKKYERLMR